MTILSYSDLQAELANWIGRDDARLVGRIPTAIELVEASVRRRLRTMRSEEDEVLSVPSGASSVALPAAFIGLRAEPEIDDGTGRTLKEVGAPFIQDEELQLGLPRAFYIAGNTMHFRPAADGDLSIRIHYYYGLRELTDVYVANWLLVYHPHVYFYGSLGELFKFSGARDRSRKWLGRFERSLGDLLDIDAIDRWNGTPMAMQSRVTPLDSPLISIAEELQTVIGIPDAGTVERTGLAASVNFPVMGASVTLQAGLDLAVNANLPVMSASASLSPPGQVEANVSFPVMSAAASLSSEVTLLTEDFQGIVSSWNLATPGLDDPQDAWARDEDATATSSTGPAGGADPTTRAPTVGNGFAYTEASNSGESPWSMETPDLNASLGTLSITFDVHMRFGSAGGIGDGTLEVQGWNGTAWTTIGADITGSQQTTAGAAYLPSSTFDTYDSTGFSNTDFKFRFLFTRGANAFTGNYDCAIDNVVVTGPPGAI